MHDCPEGMWQHLDRTNFMTSEYSWLVMVFLEIAKCAEKFDIYILLAGLTHL